MMIEPLDIIKMKSIEYSEMPLEQKRGIQIIALLVRELLNISYFHRSRYEETGVES